MAYTKVYSITLNSGQCGSTDLTNFSAVIYGNLADLKSVANGGSMLSAFGYDAVISSDSAGATVIPFERVILNLTTGDYELWFKVASAAHAGGVIVAYLAIGNASIVTDQSSATSVYDSNAKLRAHLGDGSTVSGTDSTSAGNNLTVTGCTAITGKMGGGATLSGTDHLKIDPLAGSYDFGSTPFTFSGWLRFASTSSRIIAASIQHGSPTDGNPGWDIELDGAGHLRLGRYGGISIVDIAVPAVNTWHHVAVTSDAAGNVVFYLNGVGSTGSRSDSGALTAIYLGRFNDTYTSPDWTGDLDEWCFSTVVRSADEILAEYNNQNAPGTFFALTALGGTISLTATTANSTWAAPDASLTVSAAPLAAATSPASWAAPNAAIALGAVSLSATSAAATWASIAASVTASSITLGATTASVTWAAPDASLSGQLALTATTGIAAWAAPDASLSFNAVSLAAASAPATWSSPDGTIALGALALTATTASATWASITASIAISAVTLGAGVASTTWSAIDGSLQAGGTLNAITSPATWGAVDASLTMGAVTLGASTGVSLWAAPAGLVVISGGPVLVAATGEATWTAVLGALQIVGLATYGPSRLTNVRLRSPSLASAKLTNPSLANISLDPD